MPELRRDMVRDNWVIVVTESVLKPGNFPINKNGTYVSNTDKICPFCEGNESYTPPEIAAFRKENSEPNAPGWIIRTIPSKFSAFKLEGKLYPEQNGIYNSYPAIGQQEVVIGTPEHGVEFHQFSVARIELVYRMLQQRYRALAADKRIKYIQIYKNKGLFAGASQEHSHSQILGLPMVPQNNKGMVKYFRQFGECLLCTIIRKEKEKAERIVYESEYFILICPYASRFSYETWIIPKRHFEHLTDMTDAELKDLSAAIKKFFVAMVDCLDDPSYNVVVNTAPVNVPYVGGYHWYMEINPRFIVPNGLEISTGYYTNPSAPEIAAAMLREKIKEGISKINSDFTAKTPS